MFLKTWRYLQWIQMKKTVYNFNLTWRLCPLPWDREIWVKTVSLTAKPWGIYPPDTKGATYFILIVFRYNLQIFHKTSFELWWHHLWSSLYWFFLLKQGNSFPFKSFGMKQILSKHSRLSFLLDFPKTKFRTHQTFASYITFTAPFV